MSTRPTRRAPKPISMEDPDRRELFARAVTTEPGDPRCFALSFPSGSCLGAQARPGVTETSEARSVRVIRGTFRNTVDRERVARTKRGRQKRFFLFFFFHPLSLRPSSPGSPPRASQRHASSRVTSGSHESQRNAVARLERRSRGFRNARENASGAKTVHPATVCFSWLPRRN